MNDDLEDLKIVAKHFVDEMVEYIEENWEEYGNAEKNMSRSEAEYYLGHSVKGMSREEIDEEVSEIQLAYYTEGPADLEEIVTKFAEMKREYVEQKKKMLCPWLTET